jgi:hypothetical protein
VWGISQGFCNTLRYVTYHMPMIGLHKQPSYQHVELQASAHCKEKTCHISLQTATDSGTAGNHCSSCRHRLPLLLPLPLGLILFCNSRFKWISNNCVIFWISDWARQCFETT